MARVCGCGSLWQAQLRKRLGTWRAGCCGERSRRNLLRSHPIFYFRLIRSQPLPDEETIVEHTAGLENTALALAELAQHSLSAVLFGMIEWRATMLRQSSSLLQHQ